VTNIGSTQGQGPTIGRNTSSQHGLCVTSAKACWLSEKKVPSRTNSTWQSHLHLDLIGLDALIQGAHVLLREITAVIDATVVPQEVLNSEVMSALLTSLKNSSVCIANCMQGEQCDPDLVCSAADMDRQAKL